VTFCLYSSWHLMKNNFCLQCYHQQAPSRPFFQSLLVWFLLFCCHLSVCLSVAVQKLIYTVQSAFLVTAILLLLIKRLQGTLYSSTHLTNVHSFINFCQSPLWVCSTQRRHHSPEWMILSHVSCFIQGEVQWFQVLLGSLHPRSTGASQWSPVLQGEAVKICLASDSSGIHAVWPNRETPCLNHSWKMWLLCFPSHIIIPRTVIPFDCGQILTVNNSFG